MPIPLIPAGLRCVFRGESVPVGVELTIHAAMDLGDACLFVRRELPPALRGGSDEPVGLALYPPAPFVVLTIRPGVRDARGRPPRGVAQHHVVGAIWNEGGRALVRVWSPGDRDREHAIGPFDLREDDILSTPPVTYEGRILPLVREGWKVGRMDVATRGENLSKTGL